MVDVLNVICKGAAVMWPLACSSVATCLACPAAESTPVGYMFCFFFCPRCSRALSDTVIRPSVCPMAQLPRL